MITVRVMESSGDYNNHHVTIKDKGNVLIDTYLMGFNNTPLAFKLGKLCINKQPDSIEALDCYGYKGELENTDIVSELEQYNKEH